MISFSTLPSTERYSAFVLQILSRKRLGLLERARAVYIFSSINVNSSSPFEEGLTSHKLLQFLLFFCILMNFYFVICISFFYTLTYEHVGKIQKTEKKSKHLYHAD